MWWWFLTCDNTVQKEIFNRISMKLLMRQHGSYSTTCFWRTNLNEGTDLATLIPASFSLFSTGFAVLYRSSEASAGPLVLHLELECISCVAWIWLQGCLWQCKSKEQGSKSVVTAKKVSCPCILLALERSSETPSGCTPISLVQRWGRIFLIDTGVKWRQLF